MTLRQNVLVIGGAGYAGTRLVPALLEKYRVKVLDTFWYGQGVFERLHHDTNLELVRCDVREIETVKKQLSGIDIVIHLACISNDPSFDLDPNLGKSINLLSFEPIVKLAKNSGVKRFVYASSSSVYGIKSEERVTENLTLEPLTDYSRFKAECEKILLEYSSNDFVCTVLRPATLCGYSERQRFDLVVNILTNHAINTGRIRVFGGSQYRPNLHIEDMVDAYLSVLSQPVEKVKGEIFNVGGANLTIQEIAETVSEVTGISELEYQETNDPRSYRVDSSKIASTIGFRPKRTVHDAVKDITKAFELGLYYKSLDNPHYFNISRMKELEVS
jgi:nucleoside-diphosphate-sugar epimerase